MCGRFTLYDLSKFNININYEFKPNFNISPGSNVLILNEKKLPIYQPNMVKFQLVDSTIQHIKRFHKIDDFSLVNQNNIEVIGDNIEFSEDSNKFGLINNEKIIGIVTSKLIIPKLKNFLIQKNRSTSLNPK